MHFLYEDSMIVPHVQIDTIGIKLRLRIGRCKRLVVSFSIKCCVLCTYWDAVLVDPW